MSYIGKEAYYLYQKTSPYYTNDAEWVETTIIAEFENGDVLVSWNDSKDRVNTSELAFKEPLKVEKVK